MHDAKLQIRLPSRLKNKIRKIAKSRLVSESVIIREALLAHLKVSATAS
jgi:predicted transcriptional regulator